MPSSNLANVKTVNSTNVIIAVAAFMAAIIWITTK